MATPQALRGYILAAGVFGITVAGAIYGAQMKDSVEAVQRNTNFSKTSNEDRIAGLESRIKKLTEVRDGLKRKIEKLEHDMDVSSNVNGGERNGNGR